MRIVPASVGAVFCDMLTPLSVHMALALADFTFPGTKTKPTGVIRYLENLTPQELASNLASGLAVMLVGEAPPNYWAPSAQRGTLDGQRQVARAKALSIPQGQGAEIWVDLEVPAPDTTALQIADYSKADCQEILSAGFDPGGYVGEGIPLSPEQLYLLPFLGYWHSLSNVQPVANVDYKMIQLFPTQALQLMTGSLSVDLNIVQRDKRLRLPTMIVAE
jgi:hypothetical protein